MTADIDRLDRRFRRAPQAVLDLDQFHVAWPDGGLPVALDAAAHAMLQCFDSLLSTRELAQDLVATIGLSAEEADRSALSLVDSLLRTGHLIPEGLEPMPTSLLGYPPAASP